MPIRIPKIIANSGWSTHTGTTAGEIWSPIVVDPQPGETVLDPAGLPINGDTIVLNLSTTYTILDSPSAARDVQRVTGDAAATIANLAASIMANDSTVFKAWIDSGTGYLHIQTVLAGDGNDVSVTGSAKGVSKFNEISSVTGNEGASAFSGDTFTVEVNGTPNAVTISAHTDPKTVTDLATDISGQITGATAAANGDNRIGITHDTTGVTNTLEVTATTSTLFELDAFAEGKTTSNPQSDNSASVLYIRMYHPADPVFFRNDNRPLIDLADNDMRIYSEFIAFRDGYEYSDYLGGTVGDDLNSIDSRLHLKAPAGYTFDSSVTFKGPVILDGGNVFQQNVSILNVADKLITANAGETGSGVTGTGISGLMIDRGTAADVGVVWDDFSDRWEVDGEVIGTTDGKKSLTVDGTLVEKEQITIGDGVTTFGTYNAASTGNVSTAIASAISALSNGGRIYIKRGDYFLGSTVSINTDNIHITGEGASTVINTRQFRFQTATTVATNNTNISNMRLTTPGTSVEIVSLTGVSGTFTIGNTITGGGPSGTLVYVTYSGSNATLYVDSPGGTYSGTVTDGTATGTFSSQTPISTQLEASCIRLGTSTYLSSQDTLINCWFEQQGTGATDLLDLNTANANITGNVSTTDLTGLP